MKGRCALLRLGEDNARLLLLAAALVLYMLGGAALFQHLEADAELRASSDFWRTYADFRRHYLLLLGDANYSGDPLAPLHRLLYAYGNASAAGVVHKRRRWDFPGSFHFVGTVVSTIGYGNTTPQTTAGKAAVIVYGFLGCSGGILFFNLFLERIITFLAYVLRSCHLRRIKRRMGHASLAGRRVSKISRASLPDDLDEEDAAEATLDDWKPSVYWVMLYLTLASALVASCAAAVYAPFEDWSFFEAFYFCFVSFATIGFGDYVSTQEPSYPHVHWYRFGNFVFLVLGCCCTYSLFNVTSIVIKQALNYVIERMDFRCCEEATGAAGRLWRRHSLRMQSRRRRRRSSAGMPRNLRRGAHRHVAAAALGRRGAAFGVVADKKAPPAAADRDSDSNHDSEGEGAGGRRLSGEMISMKDFLQANKVSLAVMQKQLYETAQMQRGGPNYAHHHLHHHHGPSRGFTPGAVGPLAIVSQKLGD